MAPLKPGSPSDTLADELAAFLVDRQAQRLSPRTITFYRQELGYFAKYLRSVEIHSAQQVTPDHIRQWLLKLGETRNPGGLHCNYRPVKTFLRWAWAEYELDGACPIQRVKPPKLPNELLEPVTMETLSALLSVCGTDLLDLRNRAMLLFLLDTGVRAGELCGLSFGDANMAAGSAMVKKGKGGKSRIVYFGSQTRRAMLRYLRKRGHAEEGEPLFESASGGHFTPAGLRTLVRRISARAGVAPPSLHSFRRAFALMSLRNGADVYSLQRLMGHAGLTVLRRYLAQTEEDLQAVHARSSPADHL